MLSLLQEVEVRLKRVDLNLNFKFKFKSVSDCAGNEVSFIARYCEASNTPDDVGASNSGFRIAEANAMMINDEIEVAGYVNVNETVSIAAADQFRFDRALLGH